jgi:hypothetical protein
LAPVLDGNKPSSRRQIVNLKIVNRQLLSDGTMARSPNGTI